MRHLRQRGVIVADIGHLVRHDHVALGIHRCLHVVADDPRSLASAVHRTRIRVRQRDLLIRSLLQLPADLAELANVRFDGRHPLLQIFHPRSQH